MGRVFKSRQGRHSKPIKIQQKPNKLGVFSFRSLLLPSFVSLAVLPFWGFIKYSKSTVTFSGVLSRESRFLSGWNPFSAGVTTHTRPSQRQTAATPLPLDRRCALSHLVGRFVRFGRVRFALIRETGHPESQKKGRGMASTKKTAPRAAPVGFALPVSTADGRRGCRLHGRCDPAARGGLAPVVGALRSRRSAAGSQGRYGKGSGRVRRYARRGAPCALAALSVCAARDCPP